MDSLDLLALSAQMLARILEKLYHFPPILLVKNVDGTATSGKKGKGNFFGKKHVQPSYI